jgi:hypothetical protein
MLSFGIFYNFIIFKYDFEKFWCWCGVFILTIGDERANEVSEKKFDKNQ